MHLLALAWRKQFEHIPKVLALVEAECGSELGHGPGTVGWGLNCIAKWEGLLLSGVPKDNKALGHIPFCTSIFLCRDLNNLFSKANPNPRDTEQAVPFNCFLSTCKKMNPGGESSGGAPWTSRGSGSSPALSDLHHLNLPLAGGCCCFQLAFM